MKITIYAKKRTNKEGRAFYVYLSKLTKTNGDEIPVTVHFKQSAGLPNPDNCPCVIEFDRKSANLSTKEKHYAKVDCVTGEKVETITQDNQLWISNYTVCDGEYTDNSLDGFAD